jgi:crotonobetainyl-CoA:carnitine CoA-transferase CaiB-like acyl-CoA transferase
VLANQGANYLATGESPGRLGNAHPNIVPYQTFKTADGDMILACGNDNLFRKFCAVAGCEELASDARFATNGKRVENRAELTRLLTEIVKRRTTRDWVEALEAAGVPNGPINTIAQVFAEPQAVARGLRIELPHPAAGKVSLVRSPMRFSETPVEHRVPPPLLGEHTDEVLQGLLGRSDAQIAQLRAEGAI